MLFWPNIYPKKRNEIKTIVVAKIGGGLGDTVQSSAIFTAFKKMFPNAKMIYFGQYEDDALFESIPFLDEWVYYRIPIEQQPWKEAKLFYDKYKGKIDLLIDPQSKTRTSFWLWMLRPKYFISRNPLFSNWKILYKVDKNEQPTWA